MTSALTYVRVSRSNLIDDHLPILTYFSYEMHCSYRRLSPGSRASLSGSGRGRHGSICMALEGGDKRHDFQR